MKYGHSHLTDQELLLDLEGELDPRDAEPVRAHVGACWKCRVRRQELENAIAAFVRAQEGEAEAKLPPAAGPRALLKTRLAGLTKTEPEQNPRWFFHPPAAAWAAALCALLLLVLLLEPGVSRRPAVVVFVPNSALTPGATLLETPRTVCAQASLKNKTVPIALQRRVFEEYGIAGADPRAYEVDYLITPALGGADDIHNLWPHSYSATAWNAQVKDALEDHLRAMVCEGNLDLTEAQREIATNWIAAYKKYFHTNQPLSEHRNARY